MDKIQIYISYKSLYEYELPRTKNQLEYVHLGAHILLRLDKACKDCAYRNSVKCAIQLCILHTSKSSLCLVGYKYK